MMIVGQAEKTWRIDDEWRLRPHRRRGRPRGSYKEAIDLYMISRAEEIRRERSLGAMEAIRLAVDEAWESAKKTRLPNGKTADCGGQLGPTKEQIVRRIRDRFRRQRVKVAKSGNRSMVAAWFPSPLLATPLGTALQPGAAVSSGGFSFGGLQALPAKKAEWPPKIG